MKNKSITKNFIYNTLYNSMTILFPLITIPYISRILLADGLGKINYANNIVTWFLLFASLGIPRYGIREIAKERDESNNLNKTFSELFYINLISSLVCDIAYLMAIILIPYFRDKLLLYIVVGIQLFLNIFNVDWFYQGVEEYGYITKRSFIIKVLSLVAMFTFVKTHDDYVIYALIQSIALAGNYILNFAYLKRFVKFVRKKINLTKHISSIFVLLSTQLAVSIYALLDTTMLGFWCSDSIIGYYSNAQRLIKIVATLTASLGGVMLPRLVNMHHRNDMVSIKKLSEIALKIILFICLPVFTGLIFISKDLVLLLFGEEFLPCVTTLKIFSPFILFTTVGNLYGTQLLMVFGQEKKLFKSVLFGSILNFSLNFLLIKVFYHNGAALASVITECIVMLIQIQMVKKIINITVNLKFVIQLICMNIIMIVMIVFTQLCIENYVLELLISILIGGVSYITCGILFRNEIIYFFLDHLKKSLTSILVIHKCK